MNRTLKRMLTMGTMVMAQLAAGTGAHAATVSYDRDSTADFASYQKVAWENEPSDAIADRRIRAAVEAELTAKGYTFVANGEGEADLTIAYLAVVRQEREISEAGGLPFRRNLRMSSHPEGTLVVSFQEVKSGRSVWHGAVKDALARNPEQADKKTEKAVAKLLAKFPAKKTS